MSFGNPISFLQCNIYILYFYLIVPTLHWSWGLHWVIFSNPWLNPPPPRHNNNNNNKRLYLLSLGTKFYGFEHGLTAPNEHVTVMIAEAPPQYFYAQGHCANVSDSLGSVQKGHTTQMFYKQVNAEIWLTDKNPNKRSLTGSNKCGLLDIVHGFVGSCLFELPILILFPCVWPCVN